MMIMYDDDDDCDDLYNGDKESVTLFLRPQEVSNKSLIILNSSKDHNIDVHISNIIIFRIILQVLSIPYSKDLPSIHI